ncbi:DUF6492 family protein [Bradyrhizobium sp. BR 1432]|uniref:DUF6492 family protein n=1 Tax=Bradyrhizobium sp. BR 1432 TaxID=3447966 RepID=UPI003EE80CC7
MKRMSVITPSFAPDFELCKDLHRSILEYAPESVHHHIIVPRSDISLFQRLAGPRTHIRCEAEFLPSSFVPMPLTKFTVNLRQPIPPVRGWILQQVVKLAAVAASEDDVVLLVDSDIELIRAFGVETFIHNETVRFYRKPNEIDQRLPKHGDLAPGRPRAARVEAASAAACRLHLVAPSLGSGDRSANARKSGDHYRPPMGHRYCRATPFLRVDALRRVRG